MVAKHACITPSGRNFSFMLYWFLHTFWNYVFEYKLNKLCIYFCFLTYILKWSILNFSSFMHIFNLLLLFQDMVFELQNKLMKKWLFKKKWFFNKKINLLQPRFYDPDRSLNRKREMFKVFEVEPRSNRGRTVMTS